MYCIQFIYPIKSFNQLHFIWNENRNSQKLNTDKENTEFRVYLSINI